MDQQFFWEEKMINFVREMDQFEIPGIQYNNAIFSAWCFMEKYALPWLRSFFALQNIFQ